MIQFYFDFFSYILQFIEIDWLFHIRVFFILLFNLYITCLTGIASNFFISCFNSCISSFNLRFSSFNCIILLTWIVLLFYRWLHLFVLYSHYSVLDQVWCFYNHLAALSRHLSHLFAKYSEFLYILYFGIHFCFYFIFLYQFFL